MNLFGKLFLIGEIIILSCAGVNAQDKNDTAALFREFKHLQSLYHASEGLAFDIRYIYASELHPAVILDSLSGTFELSGDNFHYELGGTEVISNPRYNIALFKEDKLMYLSKPVSDKPADPIGQIWLTLQSAGAKNCAISVKGNVKSMRVAFTDSSACREMEMDFDVTTGYVLIIRYVVKTELLMQANGNAETTDISEYGPYAIVQATFTHYRPVKSAQQVFNESEYFYKKGDEFIPTDKYSDFKVFKGSENL